MELASLTAESARALEGAAFRVELAHANVVLTLDGVHTYAARQAPRPRPDGAPGRDPFALHFSGPRSPILPQAIYTLRGDTVTFDQLFIVPVGQNGEATQYEAVFT